MRKAIFFLGLVTALCLLGFSLHRFPPSALTSAAQPGQAQPWKLAFDTDSLPLTLKLTFGIGDPEPTAWDGVAHLDRGEFLDIRGWMFNDAQENIHAPTVSWRASSKPPNFDTRVEPPGEPPRGGRQRPPYGDSPTRSIGVWLRLQAPLDALLTVNTKEGSFDLELSQLPTRGRLDVLSGRASVERALPMSSVTATPVQEDYPSIAADPDGRLCASWVGYENGGDAVLFSLLERNGWSAPQRVTEETGIYGATATAVDGRGRTWVIYNALEAGQFDLWARQMSPLQGPPVRITDHAGNDINFRAAADGQGNIWLVWQGLRERNSDIFAMRSQGFDSRPPEIRITRHAGNDWDPSIALDSRGNAAIVWDTYRNGNYDIYWSLLDASGRPAEPAPVAAGADYEVHASAVFDQQDRLWIAFEKSGENWGKDTGQESAGEGTMLHTYRELELKSWHQGSWYELESGPSSVFGGLPLNFQEQPQLLVDRQGRLWLFFRQWISRQNPPEVWNLYATYFDGVDWRELLHIPYSEGRLKQDFPAVPLPDGSVALIYASDHRGTATGRNRQWDIFWVRLTGQGPVHVIQGMQNIPAAIPATQYRPTPNKGYETLVGDRKYYLFYGDLHRHTDIRGHGGTDVSVPDQYRYAFDAAELDFMATTDHNLVAGDSWTDGLDEYAWWRTQKNADAYLFPGRFISLFAYERSFTTPGGHRNIVWPDRSGELIPGDRRIAAENIPLGLWRRLKNTDGISIPHTIAEKTQPRVGWDWHDEESQPVMEMYQGARSSYEHAGAAPDESRGYSAMDEPGHFLWDALAQGHRIGVIASSDHGSTHLSYAAVYATDFTREAIFDALKSRRTLAATDNIVIDFRIADTFIGEEASISEPPQLEIRARGTGPIRQVDVIKNNRILFTRRPDASETEFTYLDPDSESGRTDYYYVRVIQDDQMIAWSSAIWVTRR